MYVKPEVSLQWVGVVRDTKCGGKLFRSGRQLLPLVSRRIADLYKINDINQLDILVKNFAHRKAALAFQDLTLNIRRGNITYIQGEDPMYYQC